MTPTTLIDTDVLSMLMRGSPSVSHRATRYLESYPELAFSIITQFEVMRGLKFRASAERLQRFNDLCRRSEVIPLTNAVVECASDLYADLRKRGMLLPDADLLIAATAIERGLVLATNNVGDFIRVSGLRIDNWAE